MSEVYDRCLGPVLFAPYARHLAGIAAGLAPRRVLELAAGTGIVTAALTAALPDAAITASDLNPAMVDYGRSRVGGATWVTADAQDLDSPAEAFDLVVCQFGVMFFPDRPKAFAEMARVLEPGGTALLATWNAVPTCRFPAAVMAALTTVLPRDVPHFIDRVPHGYHDPDQIAADLVAGGLVVDDISVVQKTGSVSAQVLARGFCFGTPLRFELEQRGSLEVLAARVTDELLRTLGPGMVEGTLSALVVQAHAV